MAKSDFHSVVKFFQTIFIFLQNINAGVKGYDQPCAQQKDFNDKNDKYIENIDEY